MVELSCLEFAHFDVRWFLRLLAFRNYGVYAYNASYTSVYYGWVR
jgi:hypothetical protein